MSRQPNTTNHYHIGELARRSGRGVHTICWYEAQGLIQGVTRDAGGRRLYNELHLKWLDLMDRLRCTGMSIAEMRKYTALVKQGRSTIEERRVLLSAHRARVVETIAEWTAALKLIDGKIDFYGEWLVTGRRPELDPLMPAGGGRDGRSIAQARTRATRDAASRDRNRRATAAKP
jgi:DNA-binding transcriptional MerR regulator